MVVFDDLRRKAGEPRESGDDFFLFIGGKRIALLQGGSVFASGKYARFGERLGQIGLQLRRQFLVELRRGRVGGQKERIRHVVARIVPDGGKIQKIGRGHV